MGLSLRLAQAEDGSRKLAQSGAGNDDAGGSAPERSDDMRILMLCNFWHLRTSPVRTVGRHPDLTGGPHQWVRAVAARDASDKDVSFDPERDTVRDIAASCPGGYPDVMVVWEPGYQALPRGIEDAPFPVVACYSDWNLVMPLQSGTLGLYDHIFTDRRGVRVLNQMGYENAEFWPMWGHDPELSCVIPGVEQTWDIGMIGNLNHLVQRERAIWLARVGRLADRYRVRIAGGVFGEEYTRLMNATKITFNRSIRGEMNMRCYEAAACGSMLFYEEENEEVRDFFEDRVHCVLYNEHNLEDLFDYYLSHDEERLRIVAAARERVAEFSLPRSLNRLAARLEELKLGDSAQGRRAAWLMSLDAGGARHDEADQTNPADANVESPAPGAAAPATALRWTARSLGGKRVLRVSAASTAPPGGSAVLVELRKRQARQGMGALTPGSNTQAIAFLQEALEANPTDDAAHNDLAIINFFAMGETADDGEKLRMLGETFEHLRRAIKLRPNSAFYQLNLAYISAQAGRWEAALDLAQQALALIDSGADDPGDPLCVVYPPGWTEYKVQFATLYNASRAEPEHFGVLRRCLLLHRGAMLIGKIAEEQGFTAQSELGYRIAVTARPDLGSGRAGLARVLASRGEVEDALAQLRAALETDPFLNDSAKLYTDLLLRANRLDEARAWVTERRTLMRSSAHELAEAAPAGLAAAREELTHLLERRTAAA
jgi:tetratricopeptide (TPR) repeat protein